MRITNMTKELEYKLLSMSEENVDVWKAAKEWKQVGCSEEKPGSKCQCGKENIYYCYKIENKKTKKTLYPIGSECIRQFKNGYMTSQVDRWEVIHNIHKKLGLGGKLKPRKGGVLKNKVIVQLMSNGLLLKNDARELVRINGKIHRNEKLSDVDIAIFNDIVNKTLLKNLDNQFGYVDIPKL